VMLTFLESERMICKVKHSSTARCK